MSRFLGGVLNVSKVVFKENSSDAVRWFWQGRPEKVAKHSVDMDGVKVAYELF